MVHPRFRIQSDVRSQLQPWKLPGWLCQAMCRTLPNWLCHSVCKINRENVVSRFPLAIIPTRIHPWLTLKTGKQIHIKRDDETGSAIGGNKVRKLEFLLAEAVRQGADTLISCGGLQSNHCRSVALAAAQFGMECHLILRSSICDESDLEISGNLLLNSLCGAHMYLVGPKEPYQTLLAPRMTILADRLQKEYGRKCYIIPVGGSNTVGILGYFSAIEEILQSCPQDVRNIFVACGSGGTLAGLAIGNFLSGRRFRIYGISVCDNAAYFYQHVQEMLDSFGVACRAQNICHVIDGYKGAGYAISSPKEREFIASVAATTGVILDPVYTGKAALGMVTELENHPDIFDGGSLFIHTGGIFGLFGESSFHETSGSEIHFTAGNRIRFWKDVGGMPPISDLRVSSKEED